MIDRHAQIMSTNSTGNCLAIATLAIAIASGAQFDPQLRGSWISCFDRLAFTGAGNCKKRDCQCGRIPYFLPVIGVRSAVADSWVNPPCKGDTQHSDQAD